MNYMIIRFNTIMTMYKLLMFFPLVYIAFHALTVSLQYKMYIWLFEYAVINETWHIIGSTVLCMPKWH